MNIFIKMNRNAPYNSGYDEIFNSFNFDGINIAFTRYYQSNRFQCYLNNRLKDVSFIYTIKEKLNSIGITSINGVDISANVVNSFDVYSFFLTEDAITILQTMENNGLVIIRINDNENCNI